jgi:hypothetical protein
MSHVTRVRAASGLIVLFASLISAGCATVTGDQVGTFGVAAKSLTEDAEGAVNLLKASSIDMRVYEVAADPKGAVNTDTFTSVFTEDEATALEVRIQMLSQMGDYAGALQKLAAADLGKDIDEASTELRGSLSSLNDTYKKVKGEELVAADTLDIVASAVNAVARTIVEAKKRAAIKRVILETDAAVQKVSELLATDLGAESDSAKYVTEAVANSRGSMQQAYNFAIRNPGFTFEQRLSALSRIGERAKTERQVPTFFGRVSKGAKAIGTSHAALRDGVSKNQFSTKEIIAAVNELAAHAKAVKDFHDSLKKDE